MIRIPIDLLPGNWSKLRYVHDPSFTAPDVEDRLWGPERKHIPVCRYRLRPAAPDEGAPPPEVYTPLSACDERELFLRYNYAKYRLFEALGRGSSGARRRRAKANMWRDRAVAARDEIVHGNLALVSAVVKRLKGSDMDFEELASEGYMAVLRSVETFDAARGFKFSTYAWRAIWASFHRLLTRAGKFRQHFPVEFEPGYERDDYALRRHERQRSTSIDTVREILATNGANLNEVERQVIMRRYPLMTQQKAPTLKQVGKTLGISCERVRQIQKASLAKIRTALLSDDAV